MNHGTIISHNNENVRVVVKTGAKIYDGKITYVTSNPEGCFSLELQDKSIIWIDSSDVSTINKLLPVQKDFGNLPNLG